MMQLKGYNNSQQKHKTSPLGRVG